MPLRYAPVYYNHLPTRAKESVPVNTAQTRDETTLPTRFRFPAPVYKGMALVNSNNLREYTYAHPDQHFVLLFL